MHHSGRDDLEQLLRRYRPVDPPAELRTRILASLREPRVRPAWPWAVAAAALLVATVALHVAGGRETAKADTTMATASAITRERVTNDLAERLGGDAAARGLAEFIVIEQQVRSETTERIPEGAW